MKIYIVYKLTYLCVDFLKCFDSLEKAENYMRWDYVWSSAGNEKLSILEMEIE